MKKGTGFSEVFTVFLGTVIILAFLFFPVLFQHRTLFPSNLLVSSYTPWKYDPVPEYPNGPPNKPMGFDNVRQFFPNRVMLKNALSTGILPLWNPYIYSGVPFMAAFDTAVWYPLSWIAALLPPVTGWNFLVIVQPILSVLFMYAFLRSMKFHSPVAAYGAFAYGFSGWMVVYWQEILVLEHSFLWLPLALYASNRLWERDSDAAGFLLLVLALAFSVFGGFFQMAIYVYCTVLAWNIYLSVVHRRIHTRIFTAILLSVLITCIQLIPSLEAFIFSPRGASSGAGTFRQALLPFQNIITLIAPDFWGSPASYNYFGGSGFYFEKMIFIGVVPLLFALYGMCEIKNRNVLFWTVLAIVTLSMGFALPTSWLPYYLRIPVLSNSYPTRIFAVFAFSMATLSCFGLASFLAMPKRKRLAVILAWITGVLVAGWFVVAGAVIHQNVKDDSVFYATVSLRNLLIPTGFVFLGWVLMFLSKFFRRWVYICVLLVTAASGLYFAQKYVYFGETRFVYPDLPVITKLSEITGYNRVWGYGNAFIEKNLPQYFHWFSTDGYGNLSSGRYAELLSTITNDGKLGAVVRRSDTDLFAASEWDRFGSSNPYRLRMMSLFGVRYVLEAKRGDLKDKIPTNARFPSFEFTPVWEDEAWRIWEYTGALPRAVFTSHYLVRKNPQEIVDALYDPSVNLAGTVILERDPVLPSAVSTGSATITSYGLNTVTVATNSLESGFVVLSDTYYPGWVAAVDGKPADIYRADFTIRAVAVGRGKHTVIFTYKPASFRIGAALTLVGILLTAGIGYHIAKKKK